MREKRGDRTIRITKYGHWYAARQRLIAHLGMGKYRNGKQ